MGYRNYIMILDVDTHTKIKDMTYKQLQKSYGDDYVPCYNIAKEVHEMGKYVDTKYLKPFKKDIFSKKSTNTRFNEDGEFYIIGKDGLKSIIQSYHDSVVEYYKSVLQPSENDKMLGRATTPETHIRQQLLEWEGKYSLPYNLDADREEIVSSWKFEYTIFELARIYKSIDETKQLVCLAGW